MGTPSDTLHGLLGPLADRWAKAQDPEQDALALARVTLIEARRNLAVLDVAVGQAQALPPSALWQIPAILETEALGAVLGQGALVTPAFATVRRLKPSDSDGHDVGDILTQLYVRISALRALASLRKRSELKAVRVRARLTGLRTDIIRVVAVLARDVRK